jgi:hypothetical protein
MRAFPVAGILLAAALLSQIAPVERTDAAFTDAEVAEATFTAATLPPLAPSSCSANHIEQDVYLLWRSAAAVPVGGTIEQLEAVFTFSGPGPVVVKGWGRGLISPYLYTVWLGVGPVTPPFDVQVQEKLPGTNWLSGPAVGHVTVSGSSWRCDV